MKVIHNRASIKNDLIEVPYTYGAGLTTSESTSAGGDATIKLADNVYSGGQYITTRMVGGLLKATGWSSTNKYYPHFCGILAHERQHANGEQAPPGGTTDNDSDWLTNTFETDTSKTDPQNRLSASTGCSAVYGFTDDEIYAGGPVEQAGIAGADKSKDWAYPGSNSKQP